MHSRLRERLARWKRDSSAAAYAVQMWNYTLDALESGHTEKDNTENCDAVPYVCLEPESFGVKLDARSRVLDLGCLAGYGLFDFAARRSAAGLPAPQMVGVDFDAVSVRMGADLARLWAGQAEVEFLRADAGRLPISSQSADLVIARLLLPYVRLRSTASEIARVLRPGGLALLQVHSFRYYLQCLKKAVSRPKSAFYYSRPIISGLIYATVGRQMKSRLFSETALSPSMLKKLCLEYGLEPVWQNSLRQKPVLLFRKS